jgi:hypothetical protein
MGASQSSSSVSIADSITASVITQNILNCSSSLTASQTTVVGGFSMGDSTTESASISQKCLQNISVSNTDATNIAQQIQQQASAQSQALLPAYSGSSNTAKLALTISATINNSNISNDVQNTLLNQNTAILGFSFGDSTTLNVSNVQQAIQKAVANTNLSNTIMQSGSQSDTAQTNSDPLSLSDNTLYIIAAIVIGIVIVLCLPAILGMFSSKPAAAVTSPPPVAALPPPPPTAPPLPTVPVQ